LNFELWDKLCLSENVQDVQASSWRFQLSFGRQKCPGCPGFAELRSITLNFGISFVQKMSRMSRPAV
jgi:hypothetical protein